MSEPTAVTDPPTRTHQPRQATLLTVGLLLLILLLAAYLRFVGQNWDDFTHLHPDERFLTLSVLSQLGGANSFTEDDAHFPPQAVVGRQDSPPASPSLRDSFGSLGAVADTFSGDAALWHVGADRLQRFDTYEAAIQALADGRVDALMLDAGFAAGQPGTFQVLYTLSSVNLQQDQCDFRYPAPGPERGIGGYFDAACSNLNPHNAGSGFYTYGTLPLFLAHAASQVVESLQGDQFQGGHLVWRSLSAWFDLGSVVLVFLIANRVAGRWAGLIAALMYAMAPLAIQKAHFGTVNATTAFLVTLAIWFAVAIQDRARWWAFVGFGFAVGAAVASRINVAPLAGVVVIAAAMNAIPAFSSALPWEARRRIFLRNGFGIVIAGLAAFLTFRVLNPYTFTGPGFFGLLPNIRWFDNIREGSYGVSGYADSPPNWQWLARAGFFYSLKDMLLWTMGLAFGVMAWGGVLVGLYRLLRGRLAATRIMMPLVWILVYFAWMGGIWVLTPRYFLPIYGALAVLAGWLVWHLIEQARGHRPREVWVWPWLVLFGLGLLGVGGYQIFSGQADATALLAAALGTGLLASQAFSYRARIGVLVSFVLGFSLLWGVMYTNVYQNQLTRVQASRWVTENVPGDFAMQIQGAPAGTPLVNIALPNNLGDPRDITQRATSYALRSPYYASFSPAESGIISEVYVPYMGDPTDSGESRTLRIAITRAGELAELVTAELTSTFDRGGHPIGQQYAMPLLPPLQVEAGQNYQFKVEVTDGGPLRGSGAIVINEGGWDDAIAATQVCQLPNGLTLRDDPAPGLVARQDCNGQQPWLAQVGSYDQIMSFPVDEPGKRDVIRESLHLGDYVTISSNRFYDTEPRNPLRFPLTTAYYDALFSGALGYELVATFDEGFALGPFAVSDQYLPIYDAPAWLNELEADEAFHVYDHPAVFIFQKRADYDPAQVDDLIMRIPLAEPTSVQASSASVDLIGVVNRPTIEADPAPTSLMLNAEDREVQQDNGTWSALFDIGNLVNSNQVVGVVVWWLTIFLYGLVVWPLLCVIFPRMADRGYGIARIAGLLLVAWLAWVASTLKFSLWSQAGILALLVALAALSVALGWRRRKEIGAYLRAHWRRIAWIEVIALLAFLFFIGVRLTNPDLWHVAKGGEKPMDFAYFNAVLRSTTFPPFDPWYSGGFMNYYYFGFVLVGSPVLLLQVVPAVAYNLIIPTLFSVTGVGAFSIAFNVVSSWQVARRKRSATPRTLGNPWLAGVSALLFVVVLGNLDTIRVFGNGVAQLGGYSRPTGIASYMRDSLLASEGLIGPDGSVTLTFEQESELVQRVESPTIGDRLGYEIDHTLALVNGLVTGTGRLLAGDSLPIGTDRWYWGPSRVLAETPGVEGNAITEMPYFTFLYGDLHAHMISLSLILLVMFFVFSELIQAGADRRSPLEQALAIALGAIAVGVLRATNTWDWPSFLLFSVAGLSYAWWLRWRGLSRDSVLAWLARVGGLVVLSFVAALPFTSWYASEYNSLQLWQGGRTPLWAYLDIHGLFIFLIISLLVWETARWMRAVRVSDLRGRGPFVLVALGAGAAVALAAIGLALAGYQVALITLPLVAWIVPLFFRPGQSRAMQYVLVLAGFGLALTTGVEVVVVAGDIGRQNTVFKFYMQVWLVFGVASAVAFAWLLGGLQHWRRGLKWIWVGAAGLLLFIAGLFPITATIGRSFDRMSFDVPLTLDGMAYMDSSQHYEIPSTGGEGQSLPLGEDAALIRWLQNNVAGSPVIVEGRKFPSEYQWNGRISIYTGLPSVLGWTFHQKQQRTLYPLPLLVDQRAAIITAFYNTPDIDEAVSFLRHFDVAYVLVGNLERVQATEAGIRKFVSMEEAGLLETVFTVGDSAIYRVDQGALDQFARAGSEGL
jgi:YYY domain-containing protein